VIIYIIVILLPLLFYPLQKKDKHLYILVIAFMLILIMGLRGVTVGVDISMYKSYFEDAKVARVLNMLKIGRFDPGYNVFQFIIAKVFGSFRLFLFIIAIFYVSIVAILIRRYSSNAWLSFFLFISFGFFTFGLTGLRQAIAIGCTILSFLSIQQRKTGSSILWLVLGVSFHLSALIFIIVYFLNKLKPNSNNIFFIILFSLSIFIFSDQLLSVFNSFARNPYHSVETGGRMMYLFLVAVVLFSLIYLNRILTADYSNKLLYFCMISTVAIWPICMMNPVLFRLSYYYFIYIIIFIPNLISSMENLKLKKILTLCFLILGLYNFIFKVFSPDLKLLPYMFFWQ
jgi:hypothetical protein